jgi:hypothetical protein
VSFDLAALPNGVLQSDRPAAAESAFLALMTLFSHAALPFERF